MDYVDQEQLLRGRSKSSGVCKPALKKHCAVSWSESIGWTECAGSTYGTSVECKPYRKGSTGGTCCISSGALVPPDAARKVQPRRYCCSGHLTRKNGRIVCK
eukprot:Skav208614  [mRNA]  locus=scaffold248:109294:109609:- [translate_table: standard]